MDPVDALALGAQLHLPAVAQLELEPASGSEPSQAMLELRR